KARHNALSHSGAIAVIAPESTRYSDRHSDRRAVPIARSISRHSGHHSDRHSDRRAVPIAVIAPDLDGRTKVRSSEIMPNTEKITFAKLSGGDNYTYWALRMDSLLIREKLQGALGSKTHNKSEEALALIRLQLEDGPLTQIMHIKTASEAWNRLKELYNPVSFTSNFLLTKELLEM
ncbi:hypothetical protein L249_4244, partial [Ophiocordyceps polyrhachis-furcata BCC 54312]